MAKRRRLEVPTPPAGGLEVKSLTQRTPPPVAQVAGDAAALAAADDALVAIETARHEGRLAIRVPLGAIAVDHLVRDRIGVADEDMDALRTSLRAHGQRTPIEVVETGQGTYGLISGWRRLAALTALHDETGEDRFAHALAVIRTPDDAGDAYVAMVEENEIRVGLSYYERARIAALAADRGAFGSAAAAVDALFASGSRAKRSKIRSFLTIHDSLGDALHFPAHLPERLGLRLAAAIKDGQGAVLRAALTPPASNPEAEARALGEALSPAKPAPATPSELVPGVRFETRGKPGHQSLTLSGPGLDAALIEKIRALLITSKGDAK